MQIIFRNRSDRKGGHSHGSYRCAPVESVTSYARHAVRDGDGSDARLIGKCIRRDRGSFIRNVDLSLHLVAVQIQPPTARHHVALPALFKPTCCIPGVIDGNQAVATGECHISYACHALPDGNGRQIVAFIEGTAPYASHAIGNCDRGQAAATGEGGRAYARHAVRNGDGCDARLISERIRRDSGSSIRNVDLSLHLVAI